MGRVEVVYGDNDYYGYHDENKRGVITTADEHEKLYCFTTDYGEGELYVFTKYKGVNVGGLWLDISLSNFGTWSFLPLNGDHGYPLPKYGPISGVNLGNVGEGTSSFTLGHGWSIIPNEYYRIKGKPSYDDMSAIIYGRPEDAPSIEHIESFPTNWKLYIDGTKLPNYKLLWDNDKADENAVIHVLGIDNDILTNTPKDTAHSENVYSLHDECKITYKEFNALCGNLPYDEGIGAILPKSSGWLGMYMTDGNKKSSTMVIQLFPKATNPLSDGEPKLYYHPHFWNSADDGSTLTIIDNGKTTSGEDAPDPDKDDDYENHKDEEDENLPDTANNSIGVLTSTYKMTRDRLSQLGAFLWSGNIFDSFSLVNSNPIENIISCKDIPFSIGGGTDKTIKLGNVDTGVNGEKVNTNFSELTIGSITIPKKYNNFLDLAPYTKATIYLPYIGFKELDVTQIMGKTITIKYAVDVITGGCIAEIFCNATRLYEFSGQVGIDIPITASNRAQVEAGYISNAVSSGADLVTGDVLGASETMLSSAFSKYHYSSTSAPSPSCVASVNRTCYIVIDRPTYDNLKIFNHTRGRMCNLSKKIGNLKGFTICDSHIDLSGIVATDAEKDEIIKILSSGFFA